MSMSERINRGFLLAATFFIIIVFYLFLSLLANPDSNKNPFKSYSNYIITIIDILLLVASGYWMSYRLRSESHEEVKADVEEPAIQIPDEDGFEPASFHLCMVLASFYLAMLASAWYSGDYTIRPNVVVNYTSTFTKWLFTLSIWGGFAVFVYVLIVPLLNTSRNFSLVCYD